MAEPTIDEVVQALSPVEYLELLDKMFIAPISQASEAIAGVRFRPLFGILPAQIQREVEDREVNLYDLLDHLREFRDEYENGIALLISEEKK